MPVTELKDVESYHNAVKASGIVIVDYFAAWCGPCKMIAPKYVNMSNEFSNVSFNKVDVGELEEIAEEAEIASMPTFKIFVNGEVKRTIIGANVDKVILALEEAGGVKGAAAAPAAAAPAAATTTPAAAAPAADATAAAAPAAVSSDVAVLSNSAKFTEFCRSGVSVVDFFATWCGPCKNIAPKFKEMAVTYVSQGVKFGKVDVEQLEEEAQDAGVQSLPTFIIYKDGVKAATVIGSDITKVKKAVDEALLKA